VKAESISTCQACGARVPAGIDFCPVCALLRAAGNDSGLKEALDPAPDSAETEVGLVPREGTRSITRHIPARIVSRFENYDVMLDQDGEPIELGRGAMGITYKAFDSDLRLPVTLKVISEKYVGDESAKLRFLREARAAAKVRHPNVGSVFHLGSSGGEYFYVMEFVEGETLESLIKRSGRLEVKLALEIASQVAAGLEAVHEQNLVHRDIKPTNIVVRLKEDGRVTAKIIDLGLAKEVAEPGSQSAISNLGAFAGTPAYASPEQLAGLGVDIRSDLYSLGVTLWEMLAGQVPFSGSATEVIDQHQHDRLRLEQLKGLPQPLVVLLEALLDKDPAQRLQSPAELLKAIQVVAAAVGAGRSVTAQDLSASSGERLTAFQKSGQFEEAFQRRQGLRRAESSRYLGQVKALFISSRVRRLTWLVTGLLIAGLVMVAVNGFLRVNQPAVKSAATSSIPIAVPEKSIAVLPFESLSENKSDTYFAAGVQEEILSKLASLSQLKVISRTSVMAYHPQSNRDVRAIGTALGVAHLVEGTVQRNTNRVRITTELIDARTDETLWSESYERDLTDIFAIQSEIAQKVASKLSAKLTPEEQRSFEKRPTTNLEAYDLYLQAKPLVSNNPNFKLLSMNVQELAVSYQKATNLLEEAVRKDSTFTLAYCLLAKAHDDLYHYHIDKTPERRALADAAIAEAVKLDPTNPEVHLAVAYHLYESYQDYDRAKIEVELAQQTLPNNSEALWLASRIDKRQGHPEAALKALEKAYSFDPRNPDVLWYLQGAYEQSQRYRDADEMLARLSVIVDPAWIQTEKAQLAFERTGDFASFRAALDSLPSSVKDHLPLASRRFWWAISARDWTAAHQILNKATDEDLLIGGNVKVPIPHGCGEIWLAALEGKHPTMDTPGFANARYQLEQRVRAHPDDVNLLGVLGTIDAFLGLKSEAIEEATRAMEIVDGLEKPFIRRNLAEVYAWTNEPDLAFQELAVLWEGLDSRDIEGQKRDPELDPIRNDPRFDKLGAQHQ
jgi:serine/threonine protein kinase/tetratricopeptide (TPR) repeat protein